MKSSAERALLLAAGEIPLGKSCITCTVETTGKTIGIIVKRRGGSQGITCLTLEELYDIRDEINNFIKIAQENM